MKHFLLFLAALSCIPALPMGASAQNAIVVASCGTTPTGIPYATGQTRPVVIDANGLICTNGAGGGSTVPTGSAGSPNAAVVTVQGIAGGTAQNVAATSLPLPAGASTSALQTQISGQIPATLGAKAGAASISVVPSTDTPFTISSIYNVTQPTSTNGGVLPLQGSTRGEIGVMPVGVAGAASDTLTNTLNFMASSGGLSGVGRLLAVSNFYYNPGSNLQNQTRGDTTGAWAGGHASIATAQVSVGTTSTLVVAARTGRQSVTLSISAANTCAFGNTGVTTTTGFPLQPVAGGTITLPTAAAIYAACSATTTVNELENF